MGNSVRGQFQCQVPSESALRRSDLESALRHSDLDTSLNLRVLQRISVSQRGLSCIYQLLAETFVMARNRVPHSGAIVILTLRILSALEAVALLSLIIYAFTQWKSRRTVWAMPMIAVLPTSNEILCSRLLTNF